MRFDRPNVTAMDWCEWCERFEPHTADEPVLGIIKEGHRLKGLMLPYLKAWFLLVNLYLFMTSAVHTMMGTNEKMITLCLKASYLP